MGGEVKAAAKVSWMGGKPLISQWYGPVAEHSWKHRRSLRKTLDLVRVHDR